MRWTICPAILALAACGPMNTLPPPEPMIITQRVEVPVPVPCRIPKPDKPAFGDTPQALKDAYATMNAAGDPDWGAVVNLLAAAWPLKNDYIERLERAFDSCTSPPIG